MKISATQAAYAWHALLFAVETCAALLLGAHYSTCRPFMQDDVTSLADMHLDAEMVEAALDSSVALHSGNITGRRLVANDFNADFARRFTFHRWLEEDVVLDRKGLERYLRRALAATGLEAAPSGSRDSAGAMRPLPLPAGKDNVLELAGANAKAFGLSYSGANPSFAAQAHHVDPRPGRGGAPWAHGRDEFMMYVRHGLRPNHHFLGIGCGPLAGGQHVVRYLLSGHYHCIEQDEYLLRAAVEYEIPANGLIYKRPRFVLVRDLGDGDGVSSAIRAVPPATSGLPPPRVFDFVAVQRWPLLASRDDLLTLISRSVRYVRPRSGRLLVPEEPLPLKLQRLLGLREVDHELDALASHKADPFAACPFSSRCKLYVYYCSPVLSPADQRSSK